MIVNQYRIIEVDRVEQFIDEVGTTFCWFI